MALGDEKGDWGKFLLIVLYGSIVFFTAVLLSGCRAVYVPVPEYHEIHDTLINKEYVDREVIKEVTVRDSSSFRQNGDTVYIERWHWERDYRYENQLKEKIDSLSHIRRDSIPYPVPVEVSVPAELKKWQKGLMWWGLASMIAIVAFLIIKIKKTFHI